MTIARRPLEAPNVALNVLEHGTGTLHVNATRVGYAGGEGVDFSKVQRQQHSGGSVEGSFGAASLVGKEILTYKPGGRWPANLVLEHLPGCRKVGEQVEAGAPINRFTDGMKPFGEGAGHDYETVESPPVLIPVWSCVSGCPSVDMDEQALRYFWQCKLGV